MTTGPTESGGLASTLVIVPARAGSRGLPGKNVRPLLGRPLIDYSISFALGLGAAFETIVSTDAPEIAELGRELGAWIPFLRPAALATDTATSAAVIRHAVTTLHAEQGRAYESVLLLEPTSPARRVDDIQRAIATLRREPHLDGVVAVSEPHFHPAWVGVEPAPDGSLRRFSPAGAGITRRQDMGRFLRINGNFYLWRAEAARTLPDSWFDAGRYGWVEIPDLQGFAIDTADEFALLEAAAGAGLIPLPAPLPRAAGPA